MAVTLALVAIAGIAAWQVGQLPPAPETAQARPDTHPPGLPARAGHPGTNHPSAHGQATPLPRMPAALPGTHRSQPPAAVGNAVLAVAPLAARAPLVRQVVAVLTTFFEAINSQDFAEYDRLFVPSMRRTLSRFRVGYAGSYDSSVTLTRLVATGPHGLAATVTFISHQHPANSPDGAPCDSWLLTLFLKQQGSALHIRHPRPGFPQSVLACH